MKTHTNFFTAAVVASVLVAGAMECLASKPPAAVLSSATAVVHCQGFTIDVAGSGLTQAARVAYAIQLQAVTGAPIVIKDSISVIPNPDGTFSGEQVRTWSHFGLVLNNDYTFTGSAKLAIMKGNTVKIVLSPPSLHCKLASNACLPTSSMGVLIQGNSVTSYIPNGAWMGGTTGLQVVPLEGGGIPASILTPNVVNSCASNSHTGQTVCTANTTDVYLLTGTTLNSILASAADTTTIFSGGTCENCGVTINSLTNQALLEIGLSASPSNTGIQFLDLTSNSFQLPVAAYNQVSEDIAWDPFRSLILSPGEQGSYDIFKTAPSVAEFGNMVGTGRPPALDSAAEDCTTGVALSTIESTSQLGQLYIADLTQASFMSGLPGSWSAPSQIQSFPEFASFSSDTSGITVAPGSHLGIVAGEFGGNQFGIFKLPATSGSGTPGVVDYAAATMPNTPDGVVWCQGLDPHTVTAYASPNTGKVYGLMANAPPPNMLPPPTYLAVIDMQALLSAPRLAGTHTVDPTYDLIAHAVIHYVSTF